MQAASLTRHRQAIDAAYADEPPERYTPCRTVLFDQRILKELV